MRPHLNRALVLEQAFRLPDGAGGYGLSWQALGTIWAEVRATSGREREGLGAAALAQVSYRIVTRAAPVGAPSRPRPDQRLREGARIFLIRAVAEADPEGRYLICHATEEVAK